MILATLIGAAMFVPGCGFCRVRRAFKGLGGGFFPGGRNLAGGIWRAESDGRHRSIGKRFGFASGHPLALIASLTLIAMCVVRVFAVDVGLRYLRISAILFAICRVSMYSMDRLHPGATLRAVADGGLRGTPDGHASAPQQRSATPRSE